MNNEVYATTDSTYYIQYLQDPAQQTEMESNSTLRYQRVDLYATKHTHQVSGTLSSSPTGLWSWFSLRPLAFRFLHCIGGATIRTTDICSLLRRLLFDRATKVKSGGIKYWVRLIGRYLSNLCTVCDSNLLERHAAKVKEKKWWEKCEWEYIAVYKSPFVLVKFGSTESQNQGIQFCRCSGFTTKS